MTNSNDELPMDSVAVHPKDRFKPLLILVDCRNMLYENYGLLNSITRKELAALFAKPDMEDTLLDSKVTEFLSNLLADAFKFEKKALPLGKQDVQLFSIYYPEAFRISNSLTSKSINEGAMNVYKKQKDGVIRTRIQETVIKTLVRYAKGKKQ